MYIKFSLQFYESQSLYILHPQTFGIDTKERNKPEELQADWVSVKINHRWMISSEHNYQSLMQYFIPMLERMLILILFFCNLVCIH